jgi:hypothetical protein
LKSFTVQPDVIIESPSVYCLVEVKRIKRGSFQQEQLARELLVALQRSGTKLPVLLLVLPKPPPVHVAGRGPLTILQAVEGPLSQVIAKVPDYSRSIADTLAMVDTTIPFTTWDAIYSIVKAGVESYASAADPIRGTIQRLADSVFTAVEWNS